MTTEQRKGEILIFIEGLIWAFFPIVTVLTYGKLPPLSSLAWSNVFAALFFGALVLYRKTWRDLLNSVVWKYVLGIAIFIGLFFYGLYFTGLTTTTAGNATLIAQFEIFTSFFFFHILHKEHISREHVIGSILMVLGAGIVLSRNFSSFNSGDLFIVLATFCAPIGNLFQQKVRKIASSETILFLRSVLTIPLAFLLAGALRQVATLSEVRSALLFLIINGAFIFGLSKLLWLEAIHRIPVTKALALNSMTPLLTLFIAWPFLHQTPTGWQLISLIPIIFGVFLLTDQLKLRKHA